MDICSAWQSVIPDSLLIEIFHHLDIRDLGKATQVCRLWKRVAFDDLLWRDLAARKWGLTGTLRPGISCWKDEVKFLHFHVPQVASEVHEVHQDEVLDVAISNNGQYFCTTSKDVHTMLWKLDTPSYVLSDVDFGQFSLWELTQYSSFNESDTLVFVCGVSTPLETVDQTGRGAVLTVPDLQLICIINLDPPTLFGAWLTDRIFIGGSLSDSMNRIKIESYKITDEELAATKEHQSDNSNIPDSTLFKTATPLYTFRGHRYHQMNLLVATVKHSPAEKPSQEYLNKVGQLDDSRLSKLVNLEHSLNDSVTNETCGANCESNKLKPCHEENWRESCDIVVEGAEKKSKIEIAGSSSREDDNVWDNIDSKTSTSKRLGNSLNCDKCLTCDIQTDSHQNQPKDDKELVDLNCCDRNTFLSSEEAMETSPIYDKFRLKHDHLTYIIFVTGDHDAIAAHRVTEDHISRDEDTTVNSNAVDKIDYYFHTKDCYITGLGLSNDQRFLFFNYREFDPNQAINFEPDVPLTDKKFSQNLKIGTIDLTTMTLLRDQEFMGHLAFSDYPAWYICLNASHSFIGSGSEDGKAYLWDRHHHVLLTTLQHQEGVVNGLAFNPMDEETCITVCDDKLIKIWRSRNRFKKISEAQLLELT